MKYFILNYYKKNASEFHGNHLLRVQYTEGNNELIRKFKIIMIDETVRGNR